MEQRSPKKHCMIVHAHYPLGETRVQREAEALVARGYQVDVICLKGPQEPSRGSHQGVQVWRLPVELKKGGLVSQFLNYLHFFILAMVKVTRLYRRQRYGTVQVHNLPDFLVFCTCILKLKGVSVILDLHDLMPEFYAGRFGQSRSLLGRFIRWQEKLACRFADHVITVSEHWRQALIKRGVPAHKCSVVMNVADDKIFSPSSVRLDLRDEHEFRLIYHGTLVYRYGLDLALQAVAQVKSDIPDIRLTLLGKGDLVPVLRQMIQDLELTEYVTLYDELRPVEELPELLQTAHLGIVPYRNDVFTDGLLPTKLMEYAAIGLPSIASRTTAIETCFRDTMVEFFEPGDADDLARCIRYLRHSPQRMAELAENSRKFNERYHWKQVSAEYAALVDRLNARPKPVA